MTFTETTNIPNTQGPVATTVEDPSNKQVAKNKLWVRFTPPADPTYESLLTGRSFRFSEDEQQEKCVKVQGKQLTLAPEGSSWKIETAKGSSSSVHVSSLEASRRNLRVGPKGFVASNGGKGCWARFELISLGAGRVALKSEGNARRNRTWFVGVESGKIVGNCTSPFPFFIHLDACSDSDVTEDISKTVETPSDVEGLQEDNTSSKVNKSEEKNASDVIMSEESTLSATAEDQVLPLKKGDVIALRAHDAFLGFSADGELTSNAAADTNLSKWKVIEVVEGRVCLASAQNESWHLRVNNNGKLSRKGRTGFHAQFTPKLHPSGLVSFLCKAHETKTNREQGQSWALAVLDDESLVGNADAGAPNAQFQVISCLEPSTEKDAPSPKRSPKRKANPKKDNPIEDRLSLKSKAKVAKFDKRAKKFAKIAEALKTSAELQQDPKQKKRLRNISEKFTLKSKRMKTKADSWRQGSTTQASGCPGRRVRIHRMGYMHDPLLRFRTSLNRLANAMEEADQEKRTQVQAEVRKLVELLALFDEDGSSARP